MALGVAGPDLIGLAAALPYALLVVALAVLMLIALLTRGDQAIRVGLLATCILALPYAAVVAVLLASDDPAGLVPLARFGVGVTAPLGAALLLVVLAISGALHERRLLLGAAFGVSAITCALTWSTDLVIAGVDRTAWGLLFPRAGPLNELQVSQLMMWPALGLLLTRRQLRSAHRRRHRRRIAVVAALASLAGADVLLAHGTGVYPLACVPALAALGLTFDGVLRHDLLRARGLDRASVWELVAIGALGLVVAAALVAIDRLAGGIDLTWAVATVVPLLAICELVARALRRWAAGAHAAAADRELDDFVQRVGAVRDDAAIAAALTDILARRGLPAPVVWRAGTDRLARIDGAADLALDARVRSWLQANPTPLEAETLEGTALGGLRQPIDRFFTSLDAAVAVPLIERGALVGLLTCAAPARGRALRDGERQLLARIAEAAARALTYVALLAEAASRASAAREVEVADALRRSRRSGEQQHQFAGCRLHGLFQPGATFGGHWRTAGELPDGRVLVVLGDVSGQGLSAALVSATLEGACETALRMSGSALELLTLLEVLERTLLGVGRDRHTMACFAALIDAEARQLTFASAGHPFPYVLRAAGELRALVSRGTPLGMADPVVAASTFDLADGDVLVFFSDTLVEARNGEGRAYGERRLQRAVRAHGRAGPDRACRYIADDVRAHAGDTQLDDLTLLLVQVGGG